MCDRLVSNVRYHRRRRGGFTMIEIMTVIGIILILIGLFFAGARQWRAQADVKATQTRMEVLNSMLSAMEAAGPNTFHDPGNQIVTPTASATSATSGSVYDQTAVMMNALLAIPGNSAAMNQLPTGAVASLNSPSNIPYRAILDGWGQPIVYVPAAGLNGFTDATTTTITSPDARPFWASAGPDGNLQSTYDNLYSFKQ
jgi:prepilin-type N-terminal cleavage/methylation domain-containing protein